MISINKKLICVFEKSILKTKSGRVISEKQGRYNSKLFSYSSHSGFIYTFPQYTSDKFKTSKKDCRKNREILIGKTIKAVNKIRELGGDFGFTFDQEVFIKLDTELWKTICGEHGLTQDNFPKSMAHSGEHLMKHLNKEYISLDLYEPRYGINIEHDGSKYHDVNDVCDNIRDEYLRLKHPFLKIARIRDFNPGRNKCVEEVKTTLQNLKENTLELFEPQIFDYSQEIYLDLFEKFKPELLYLSELMDKNGYEVNQLDKFISKELKNLIYV